MAEPYTDEKLWNDEEPVSRLGFRVPPYIEGDISPSTIAAIVQGGCDSGAYMPAVTYHTAREIMAEHGDQVFDDIEGVHGAEALEVRGQGHSWSGMACHFLSLAVETWAACVAGCLESGNYDEEGGA